ncbi:MAG: TonB family protein [Bacteroidia bacterium]
MKTSFSLLLIGFLLFPVILFSQTETPEMRKTEESELPFTKPKIKNIDALDPVKYPLKAVSRKIEGAVRVEVEVDEAGKYVAHNIVESADSLLSAAVDPYISQLKFEPARRGELAVPAVMELSVIFNIEKRVPIKTEIRVKY